MVIVLGEELGRFRDASKSLYKFLASFTWSGKVERLGFDEVWMVCIFGIVSSNTEEVSGTMKHFFQSSCLQNHADYVIPTAGCDRFSRLQPSLTKSERYDQLVLPTEAGRPNSWVFL